MPETRHFLLGCIKSIHPIKLDTERHLGPLFVNSI